METSRLQLRRFTLADAADVYQYAKDPEVGPNAGWKPHPSEAHSKSIIQEHFLKQAHGFAIVEKATNKVIGSIGLTKQPFRKTYELGYSLSKAHWGQGLMTEAAQAILTYGFTTLKANRIFAKTHKGNHRSDRVLQKLGMTYERFKPRGFRRYDGVVLDVTYFSITYSTWRQHAKT
jgi:[ribosomal protein S5]-alanine N-acetyltransferase